MIESMRKNMKWLMWITVALVTVTFLFFGIYPSNVGGGTVAKVGDDVITKDEFNQAYRNIYELYRGLLKDQVNESVSKELKVQALRDLISNKLLSQEANRLGLKVTDEELQAAIVRVPAFAVDGKFDKRRYERALNVISMTPAVFEASERENLLRQKLIQLIRDSVVVPESELEAAFKRRNPKAAPGAFARDKENFQQIYLAGKQREAISAYIRGIYDKTSIKINDKMLSS
jgi:peptidyl-prolyl cis-trans isomerase D